PKDGAAQTRTILANLGTEVQLILVSLRAILRPRRKRGGKDAAGGEPVVDRIVCCRSFPRAVGRVLVQRRQPEFGIRKAIGTGQVIREVFGKSGSARLSELCALAPLREILRARQFRRR